jgi:hypothetical protein
MHSFLTPPVLAAVGEYIPIFGMLIPITVMFIVMLIVVAGQHFKNQSRKMWHETARIALEKGQPVPIAPSAFPPAIEEALGKKLGDRPSGRGDVKAALILIAIAAGMYLGFEDLKHDASFVIYVPGFIGVALLLNALITFLTNTKNPEKDSSPHSPKA